MLDQLLADAGDLLTQTSMSPETKEVLDQILDQYYGNLIDTITYDGFGNVTNETNTMVADRWKYNNGSNGFTFNNMCDLEHLIPLDK